MEDIKELMETRLGFELKMKEGKALPKEYSLFIGLKASGAILAKSLEGVMLIPWGELAFKHGGPFAKIYVLESKGCVVLAAESDLHYDQAVLAEAIRGDFLQGATRTIIVESLPWAMVRTWGHTAFDLGLSEDQNCTAVYDKEECIPIKETLGAHIFSSLKTKPVKYYLHLVIENAVNFTDSKQLGQEVASKEGLVFVENKIRSSVRTALQTSSYI
jgi:hypothetical protein